MRITAVYVKDFKGLRELKISPPADRSLVVIGGKNGAGKSSLLDAITAALAGKDALPADPVRHGAESAEIRVELDDGALIVRRTIKDGESVLELRDADGKLSSPQARLNKLIGARFLDPLRFLSLSPADQRGTLLSLIDKDGAIDKLEAERAEIYRARTDLGRDAKRLRAQLEGMPDVAVPEPVDVSAITDELRELDGRTRAAATAKLAAEEAGRTRSIHAKRIAQLEEQIAALDATLEEEEQAFAAAEAKFNAAKEAVTKAPTPSPERISELGQKLREASAHNQRAASAAAAAHRRAELARQVEAADRDVQRATRDLDAIAERKVALLAGAALPVPGLDVGVDGVTIGGVPLAQASGAEQMRVALALAIAANSNLRDVWVRDGSLLDDESLATLEREVVAAGVTAWVERVGDRDPGAIIIAEGRAAT